MAEESPSEKEAPVESETLVGSEAPEESETLVGSEALVESEKPVESTVPLITEPSADPSPSVSHPTRHNSDVAKTTDKIVIKIILKVFIFS